MVVLGGIIPRMGEVRGLSPLPSLGDEYPIQSPFLNFVKPISRLWLGQPRWLKQPLSDFPGTLA